MGSVIKVHTEKDDTKPEKLYYCKAKDNARTEILQSTLLPLISKATAIQQSGTEKEVVKYHPLRTKRCNHLSSPNQDSLVEWVCCSPFEW